MHAKAQQLLEAHAKHILDQLTGENLHHHIDNETATFCGWLATRPVRSLVDEVTARDFIHRNILGATPSEEMRQQAREIIKKGLNSPSNQKVKIEHLLNGQEYDLIVERIISLEELRRSAIKEVLNNPAYNEFLSNLLYQNIKDYLLEDNIVAKKVPGMSSLMKVGKGVMGKMGNLESSMENTLKSYIQKNIRSTIDMSEQLILNALETPKLRSISRQFWSQFKGKPISDLTRHIKPDDVDASADIANTVWNHFRQTSYAKELTTELVHAWYEQWGDQPAMSLLKGLGYSPNRITIELKQVVVPYIDTMRESGFLELRIRAYLEPFYSSDFVADILDK